VLYRCYFESDRSVFGKLGSIAEQID